MLIFEDVSLNLSILILLRIIKIYFYLMWLELNLVKNISLLEQKLNGKNN